MDKPSDGCTGYPDRSGKLEEFAEELTCEGRTHGTIGGRRVELAFDEVLGWVECAIGRTRCASIYLAPVLASV